jgi:hypothetical protein
VVLEVFITIVTGSNELTLYTFDVCSGNSSKRTEDIKPGKEEVREME